jgi:hypothetical protein
MAPLNAKRLGLALGPALVLASCGLLEPQACTLDVPPSIVVGITDSITGEPMAADAHGFIRDGEFVDSLLVFEEDGSGVPLSRHAGPDRPGRYLVVLYHAGYDPWVVGSVEVEDRGCHVETVRLEARLVPSAGNVNRATGSTRWARR